MTEGAEHSGIKTFPQGTLLVREGPDSPRNMFLILRGSVGVYQDYGTGAERETERLSDGSVYGEFSLFLDQPQQATLVAHTGVAALVITRQNVQSFFSRQPKLAVSVVEGICRKSGAQKSPPDADARPETAAENGAAPEPRAKPRNGGVPAVPPLLFPKGHGEYTLPMNNDSPALHPDKISCPLCGHSFEQLSILESKLGRAATDPDMRVRYASLDPAYYEIVTCPICLLSAPSDKFPEVEKRHRAEAAAVAAPYRSALQIHTGKERDTVTVFAGYFLAALFAPVIFYNHQLVTSNLWLKISRLYQDCGDDTLFLWASKKALEEYGYVYSNLHVSNRQSQQIAFILGDLYARLGDSDNAGKFFFDVKTDRTAPPLLVRQADLRLDAIREARAAEREAAGGQGSGGKGRRQK